MKDLRALIPIAVLFGVIFFVGYTVRYIETTLGFTTDTAVINFLKGFILEYGLIVSFIGAFLEGLLLIGWYFPGSFIIFLSVILSGSPERAAVSVAVVTLAMYFAYVVNYILGRYGWYKVLARFGMQELITDAQKKIETHAPKAFFFSFWQPGLASFTSTAAGVLRLTWKSFFLYAGASLVFWNVFWGILAYTVGESIIETLFNPYAILAFIFVWGSYKLYEEWGKTEQHLAPVEVTIDSKNVQ